MSLSWMKSLAALVLVGGLAACDAPAVQQQPAPTATVLEVSKLVEQRFRSQIGKWQGAPLRFKYTRVSRKGTAITTGILFEDDLIIDLAKADPERFAAGFQTAFAKEMCGEASAQLMINSGMSITNDFTDKSGRTVFSETLSQC